MKSYLYINTTGSDIAEKVLRILENNGGKINVDEMRKRLIGILNFDPTQVIDEKTKKDLCRNVRKGVSMIIYDIEGDNEKDDISSRAYTAINIF